MKVFKQFFLGAMIAAPLLLAPARTKAGPISDFLQDIFGGDKDKDRDWDKDKDKKHDPSCPPGTSVPINGGLVILFAAGLGLGTKVIYDNKAKEAETVPL